MNQTLSLQQSKPRKLEEGTFYKRKPKDLELDRIVVYKKGRTFANLEYYIVEISKSIRGLFISLFSIESSKKNKMLEIEYDNEKSKQILAAFKEDYEKLASHLKIINDQIKIRKPDSSPAKNESVSNKFELNPY